MSRFLKFAASAPSPSVAPAEEPQEAGNPDGFGGDAILAFRSETAPEVPHADPTPNSPPAGPAAPGGTHISRRAALTIGAAAVLTVPVAATVYVLATTHQTARAEVTARPAVATGTAVLEAHPTASVAIDGEPRGQTPLTLALPAGSHTATITVGSTVRSIPLTIQAGTTTRQDVEFAEVPATAGRLDITSEPAGARVTVDGVARGQTPVALADVPVGDHTVAISSGDTTIRRSVKVSAGATSSVAVSIAAADSTAGWLSISAPFELSVLEGGQVVGNTSAARLMLPTGAHNLTLSNAQLEFETSVSIRIDAGKTTKPTIAIPNGSLSVNALPWADVLVDGKEVGTTPLANIAVPIGSHELVLRNPQLGERRRTITLAARTPTRIGVDFRQ